MTNLEYITKTFQNEKYLKSKAKQIIETDSTNDWGFDGKQSTKYIMPNNSSYEQGRIDYYSSDKDNITLNIFKIGKKEVSKEEWLKFNNIRRKTSVKLWMHSVYDGKFDKLIEDYIDYKIH